MIRDRHLWDVVVIGAGMAGGLLAASLGRKGLGVFVLESGPDAGMSPSGDRMGTAPSGRWPAKIELRDPTRPGRGPHRMDAQLGNGLGGSTIVYGAALTRMRRSDFEVDRRPAPGQCEEPVLPNAWPVCFDAFQSCYRRAEAMLGIVGERDPGDPDVQDPIAVPPPLCRRDANLIEDLVGRGYAPFRLPVGIAYEPGCLECQGVRCPRGCKADSYRRVLAPAVAAGRVTVRTGTMVRRIGRHGGRLTAEAAEPDGTLHEITARRIVLAAGALNTPRILLRSTGLWGESGPPALLGAGLMFHLSDFVAIFDRRGGSSDGPRKTICLREFYEVDGIGLGEVQSIGGELNAGLVGGLLVEKAAAFGLSGRLVRLTARAAGRALMPIARRAALMATIIEDPPLGRNRVTVRPGRLPDRPDEIAVEYRPAPETIHRLKSLRAMVRRAFAPNTVLFLSPPNRPNWGHPTGTCRMGADPETSVTDPECRLWGHPDVLVADASIMPSSGGTNPSLTVAANALRVADILVGELGPAGRMAAPPVPAVANAAELLAEGAA